MRDSEQRRENETAGVLQFGRHAYHAVETSSRTIVRAPPVASFVMSARATRPPARRHAETRAQVAVTAPGSRQSSLQPAQRTPVRPRSRVIHA